MRCELAAHHQSVGLHCNILLMATMDASTTEETVINVPLIFSSIKSLLNTLILYLEHFTLDSVFPVL